MHTTVSMVMNDLFVVIDYFYWQFHFIVWKCGGIAA